MAKGNELNMNKNNIDQDTFLHSKHPMFHQSKYESNHISHLRLNGYKPQSFQKYSDEPPTTTTTTNNNNNVANKMMIIEESGNNLNMNGGPGGLSAQEYPSSNVADHNHNHNNHHNHHHHHLNHSDISVAPGLMNKISASSLPANSTVANRTKTNSYSNMNGGLSAGQMFRNKITTNSNNNNNNNHNSYITNTDVSPGTAPSLANLATNQQPIAAAAAPTTTTTMARGQRYMANILNTSNLMASKQQQHQQQQQQQPLLNLSMLESSLQQQTSPMNMSNEPAATSHVVGGIPTLLSSSTLPQLPLAGSSSTSIKINPLNNSDPTTAPRNTSSMLCLGSLNRNGINFLLASLALMCILSLLMAFLALSFIQRTYSISLYGNNNDSSTLLMTNNHSQKNPRIGSGGHHPSSNNVQQQYNHRIVSNAKEYMKVFQISVSLSTLTIALDLCCLFVCCIQFLSIIKLLKTPFGVKRSFEFIKKTSHIRVISIGAFLVSIPIFFTGIILYTFVNFDEIPALITSIIIGIGIIFCGIASVQNVYLWQWEKTKASQDMQLSQQHLQQQQQQQQELSHQYLQQPQPPSSFLYGNVQPQQQSQSQPVQQSASANNPLYPLELSTLV